MNVTQTATTIDTPAPASFTCAECPFARHIDGNRYCCQVSQTASDVKRGHWEATISCYEALAAAEAEKLAAETEAPIAQPDTTEQTLIAQATPATVAAVAAPTPAATATVAAGPDDEPPHRGDNGRGRVLPILNINRQVKVQPIAPKKLLPSLVAVKRITSDIPASNFDQFDLEVAGELSLAIGGFIIPPVLVRDNSGYKVISGHFQYHAAVLARRLNPRAGETIPAIVLESENQATASAMLKMLKFAA
ncbi:MULTISPECIES: hypothetical protein [unclassified Microcoleus]|uniref:hypothetical protein n=1 Tax=unclassified Microcoleus TaxID=2642155 RepID=UPI002FD13030